MEEIRQTARAYYKALPEKAKGLAVEFFTAMDDNGDGKISLHEFANFMTQEGYESMNNLGFFEEINRDKSGNLDFDDVMGLYYIIKSRRPFCRGCTKLIMGGYFTCVKCFESDTAEKTFCLHPRCFENGNYIHHHNNFLDNHVMLHELRGRVGLARTDQRIRKTQSSVGSSSNTSSAITQAAINQVAWANLHVHQQIVINPEVNNRMRKRERLFRLFETAIGSANLGLAICTVM